MTVSTITLPVYSHITDTVVVNALTAAKADINTVSSAVVAQTTGTLTVTAALHANKVVTLAKADGIIVTLPAATGTGDRYTFVVLTSASGGTYVLDCVGSDVFIGSAISISDGSAAVLGYDGGLTQILLDGSTQQGYAGCMVELIDVASGKFFARITGKATGSEATPFET